MPDKELMKISARFYTQGQRDLIETMRESARTLGAPGFLEFVNLHVRAVESFAEKTQSDEYYEKEMSET